MESLKGPEEAVWWRRKPQRSKISQDCLFNFETILAAKEKMGSGAAGLWTEVLTDFDPEEETANFGTRVSLVSEGSLYEVGTVIE